MTIPGFTAEAGLYRPAGRPPFQDPECYARCEDDWWRCQSACSRGMGNWESYCHCVCNNQESLCESACGNIRPEPFRFCEVPS